ncbi:MAG: glyoxalase, partial [Anaerolineae bacterium]|nr:glyoxalase [Anaerolineae bacterium]
MSIKFQSSVLFVADMAASRQFYEGLLGQIVEMDLGANVGYKSGFALWLINSVNEVVFEMATDLAGGKLGQRNFELYFESDDLPGVIAALEAADVRFVHPLHEQPWGQRAVRVYDPDEHMVEIGEPMPLVVKRLLDEGADVA